jgi:LmbE family N-acetylglucosaminyl deacetylase
VKAVRYTHRAVFGGLHILALLTAVLAPPAAALEPLPQDRGAGGVWQTLRKLQSTVRVMHITAHPDDEDGGTLTYLSRGLGADVTLLSITRGESGANLVTGDFFDRLGALRTVEFRKAAQYYGVRLRFTRWADFGYSKSLDETLRNWDREQVVRDMVRIIREEKPHIILARWQGGPRDGHGHHQAAGLLAQLAYEAAGDANRFPEQIKRGQKAWQPSKLYSDNRREEDDWTLQVDSGIYDAVLGKTYAQFARDGLRYQRSQGAGSTIADPGPSVRYYKLLASEVGVVEKEESFLERLENSPAYRPIGGYPELARQIADAVAAFSIENPVKSAPALAKALTHVRQLREKANDPALAIKERQIESALASALGIEFQLLVQPANPPSGPFASFMPYETFRVAAPGQAFPVSAQFHAPTRAGDERAKLERIEIIAPPGWKSESTAESGYTITVAEDADPTSANWQRGSVWDPRYDFTGDELFGRALPPAPLRARATYQYDVIEASVEAEAETSYVDTIGVQHRRALAVGPALAVRIPTEAGVLPVGKSRYAISAIVRNNGDAAANGTVRVNTPAGWTAEPTEAPFSFNKEGEEKEFSFTVIAPRTASAGGYPVEAVAVAGGREYRSSFEPITYPGLETVYLSHPARHIVRMVDVKVAEGLSVGYLTGTGDDVPEGIRQLGAAVTLIDSAALATGDLSRFDIILLGIRAYAVREDVKTYNSRLLEYVERGGVLVVQYNTPEFDNNYGPYPYQMTRRPEEVSEENSPMEILEPGDPVFTTPNRITQADFDGWVEQRGSKFMVSWDPAYKALLSTHDTGQEPQRGGWLVAGYGKGLYVYCAYAWYRQLPYAVPGAVRIFANLLSLGAKDAAWRRGE